MNATDTIILKMLLIRRKFDNSFHNCCLKGVKEFLSLSAGAVDLFSALERYFVKNAARFFRENDTEYIINFI